MNIEPDTFRYLTAALAQVFAALFFGNCVFLAIMHTVTSNHRESYFEKVIEALNAHSHNYIHTPGIDIKPKKNYDFPVKEIGLRNTTFSSLSKYVHSELKSLENAIASESEMFRNCFRLNLLETEFGKACSATLHFDSAKMGNLQFYWNKYELCYKSLEKLPLMVLRALSIPSLIVCLTAFLLTITDSAWVQGNISQIAISLLSIAFLGIIHTLYLAQYIMKQTHWVTIQKEHEDEKQWGKEKDQRVAEMRNKLKELESEKNSLNQSSDPT